MRSQEVDADHLSGQDVAGPTNLQVLMHGWFIDVDKGSATAAGVTTVLRRPGRPPILVRDLRYDHDECFDCRVAVTVEKSRQVVPGSAGVVEVDGPPGSLAASSDGLGLWVLTYDRAGNCAVRLTGLDGRERRQPRATACGQLLGETDHGLLLETGTGTVLLDTATFEQLEHFAFAAPIDEERIFVAHGDIDGDIGFQYGAREEPLEIRNLATDERTGLPPPDHAGWQAPIVGPASPDGRWLPVHFADPGNSPQVLDAWVLDLRNKSWHRLPSMPTYTHLKTLGMDWSDDGRLVVFGSFPSAGGSDRELLITWSPTESNLSLLSLEHRRPSQRAAAHSADILAW